MVYLALRYLENTEEAINVRIALAKISFATGLPISSFESDAMHWCETQVARASVLLEWAFSEVMRGKLLPWTETGHSSL